MIYSPYNRNNTNYNYNPLESNNNTVSGYNVPTYNANNTNG